MDQRVVITAGGSGIGRAMAEAFLKAGTEVWVTDIDTASLKTLPEGIRGTVVDVADEGAMRALFHEVKHVWGKLDVLCANAGTKGPTALIEDVTLADWRSCLGVTLDGAFLAAKFAAPMMKTAGKGVMLFTSSTAGAHGFPMRSPYAAAKWGLHGLMKTVAMELGPFGIRANAILPGSVEGPRMEAVLAAEAAARGKTRDEMYRFHASAASMQTFVEAGDIADMAVFLASDAARFVSGQMIAVDGHVVNADPRE